MTEQETSEKTLQRVVLIGSLTFLSYRETWGEGVGEYDEPRVSVR